MKLTKVETNNISKKTGNIRLILPAICFLALLSYFFLFVKQEDFSLIQSSNYSLTSFSDSTNGGGSRILSFEETNKSIDLSYQIGNDQINYAGFNIVINDSIKDLLKQYNTIKINYSVKNVSSFNLTAKTFEKGITDQENEQSYRVNYHIINNLNEDQLDSKTIAFSQFKTREWWIGQFANGNPLSQNPNWESTLMFGISNESETNISAPSKISIYSFVLIKDNSKFFIISLIVIILSTIPFVFSKIKKNPVQTKKVIVTYQSLEIEKEKPDNWEDQIFEYIGEHYPNAELKLVNLAKHFTKSERAISAVIHDRLEITFKQYLNSIRIKEAKRLLTESDLSIKEVAYATGYSSPNNFRRVFKQIEGISPSDFKEKTQ